MARLPIQNFAPPPNLFEELPSGSGDGLTFRESGVVGEFAPAFEVRETRREFRVHADVPGVTAGNLSVYLNGRRLIVCGRRQRARETGKLWFHAYERTYGTFWRTFRLTEAVDLSSARAALQRGVLTISFRKQAESRHAARGRASDALHPSLGHGG